MADIAGNSSTTTSLDVGGALLSSIGKSGDSDWIKIHLDAGQSYSFNLVAAASNGDASFNPVLSLYGSDGSTLIDSNDNVGAGLIVNPLIGGDNFKTAAYLHFTANATGDYYLAASGSGTSTGDYMLSAYQEDIPNSASTPATLEIGGAVTGQASPPNASSYDDDYYKVPTVIGQYYTVTVSGSGDNPLHSTYVNARTADGNTVITEAGDWGFGVSRITFQAIDTTTILTVGEGTAGASGQYTLQIDKASPLDTVEWNILSPKNIKVYFVGDASVVAPQDEHFTAKAWTQDEIDAAMKAYGAWSDVANVHFTQVSDPSQADFFMFKAPQDVFPDGALAHWDVGGGTAQVGLQDYQIKGAGVFNADTTEWTNQQLGGDGFLTLVHEIGHGMGLAHPFDNGGGSAALPGTTDPFGQLGAYSLNQSIDSVMAYNRSFAQAFGSTYPLNYGGAASPMALDIAAMQGMYGANTDHNGGNDTYVLPTVNDVGTYFQGIWDTGGKDTIVQNGSDSAVIDLRPASLQYDSIGGGGISYVVGIRGGFTVANGVDIENAAGGSGNDHIVGSDKVNTLHGNGGTDFLAGLGGNDKVYGDDGSDTLYGDGVPAIASGVGAGTGAITKTSDEVHSDSSTALDITGDFAVAADPNVVNSATDPHVTISATAGDSRDWYKLTVAAGVTITVDIDGISGGIDTNVLLYGADTTSSVSTFRDSSVLDGAGGSTSTTDSFGSYTTVSAGTYYIRVSNAHVSGGSLGAGTTYTLQVSVSPEAGGIDAGAGNDTLDGGGGADSMVGGGGNDTYIVDDPGDVVTEVAGGGKDTVKSSIGYTLADQVENLVLTGSDGISGAGNGLDNRITGNAGANKIEGMDGNDSLIGGGGIDQLYGDGGSDTFVFDTGDSGKTHRAADTIFDFTKGDHIDLTGWDANSKKAGIQAFTFIGADAFDGQVGELHYVKGKSDTWIEGDTNGDKKADFVIHLDEAVTIKASYFDH
jgi:hypothetical protein